MNEMENKAVEATMSSSSTDKMTSCSSLVCKYDDDTDDVHIENQKIQQKQQRQCLGSQSIRNDLPINGSMNILEDVVRCLLDKDTSALGFQIAQRSDGICISYVEPNGPADRSGNIFVGDKIKEVTITFENMPISDALTILSCASTYKVRSITYLKYIRLELERAVINDIIQSDCTETTEHLDTSNPIQQSSFLYKSRSTSDLAPQIQKAQMPDKTVNGGSFMSKQKYQLSRQSVINIIKEEASSIIPETSSPSSPSSDFIEKTEFVPIMTESVISEETIIISDESLEPLPPVLKSLETSPNEISLQPQNQPCAITSKSKPKANCTSNSTPLNIFRKKLTPQISSLCSEYSVLSLIPKENNKVDEIKCNGFSDFVERSHFMYSNASIKDDIRKNCVEFCELIEPKRESIVMEFEENHGDDDYQKAEEEMINLPNCNDTFDEAENDLYQANSNINSVAPMETPPNCAIIDAVHTKYDNDSVSGNISNRTNVKCSTSHYPVVTVKALTDPPGRTDIIENKSSNFNTEILLSSDAGQIAGKVESSEISNHSEINEFNDKHIIESRTSVDESPSIPRKIINENTSLNETSQRSSKCIQLRKLSNNCGSNEAGKEIRKLNGDIDDLKDEGNNRSNIPQRSPKWSPKLQSHIPIVTRTPSTKSKNKLSKAENNKVAGNSTHVTRNKTSDDTVKNDMNGALLYIAKKEALRKTHLPFSKLNKSEEVTDLTKERKARLEANQALLQRQQDELKNLGILP
ncbi:unnamed protein product [Onchocerca ochengi]|uniref:PDZ domain-containing protein n=1 Tax=Onchocerca ochengi TaxID=42157 RepID=A0A182EMX3_ONCOC|nr:unnamed protein product [Onchocerca ochengi]